MRLKVSNFAIGANVIVFFGLVSVSSGKENVKRLRLKRLSRREENSIGPKGMFPMSPFESRAPQFEDNVKAEPRMLSPGYYSQECNAHKPCEKSKYCHMFLCVHCLKENVACTQNGQCCAGQCTYGRCKKDAPEGAPGTFCDRHDDCKDPKGTCCVREPSINPRISICKPPLEENMVCGPINFFRNVYIGAQVQKACGPCKQGLICKQVGVFGIHEICVKEDDRKKK